MNIRQALQEAKDAKRIIMITTMNASEYSGRVIDLNTGNDGFVTLMMDTGPAKRVHVSLDAVVSVVEDA